MFRRPRAGAEEAERGFTLVELMCVVLILALLMAIGLPTWTAARTRASDSAARAVLTESHHALKVVMADYRDLSTLTIADLVAVEPGLTYVDATTHANGQSNEVSVEVGNTGTVAWVILSTYSHGNGCVGIRELDGCGRRRTRGSRVRRARPVRSIRRRAGSPNGRRCNADAIRRAGANGAGPAGTLRAMTALVAAICGVFGLLVGSFLNVVIWRVPRRESVVVPAVALPALRHRARAVRQHPGRSRGWCCGAKCRHCGTPISARYPAVELLTALLWAATGARFADSWVLPAYLVLAAGLVALSLIDLDTYLLPNRVLYPVGFIVGRRCSAVGSLLDERSRRVRARAARRRGRVRGLLRHPRRSRRAAWASATCACRSSSARFLGWLGWWHVVFGLFAGFLYGAVVGVALMALGSADAAPAHSRSGRSSRPGPLTIVLVGTPIIDWYAARPVAQSPAPRARSIRYNPAHDLFNTRGRSVPIPGWCVD